jgi:rRNA pseudouridine-1189 N-methylase Emg1 (Nep1/Mra1 family)
MLSIFYWLFNKLTGRYPLFSQERYLRNVSRYTKSPRNREHFDRIMVELLSDPDAWFKTNDGAELVQLSRNDFRLKNKKHRWIRIPAYWVEWKKKGRG